MVYDLSYVLDYANIIRVNKADINQNDIISWLPANILPGKSLVHHITVRIKNPIPQTPPSTSDPMYFDHIMTNVYGNTINIYLPKTPITVVTNTTTSLPNTGPGSSVIFAALVTIIAGYFFLRAKLLAKETRIVIQDNNWRGYNV